MIQKKILEMAKAIGAIAKDGKVSSNTGSYSYQKWDDVQTDVRAASLAHNVLIVPSVKGQQVTSFENSRGNVNHQTLVEVDIAFIDADEPESQFTITWQGQCIDASDKGTQKAITNACKYAFLKLFQIPFQEEEADASVPIVETSKPKTKTQPANGKSEKLQLLGDMYTKLKPADIDKLKKVTIDELKTIMELEGSKEVKSFMAMVDALLESKVPSEV